MDVSRTAEPALARDICGGCNNYCMAARRPAAGASRRRRHSVLRRVGNRGGRGNWMGAYLHAGHSKLVLPMPRRSDGIRIEL